MASIDTVTTVSGQKRYKVRWREGKASKKATFARFEDARRYKTKIERTIDTGEYLSPERGRITLGEWFKTFIESTPLQPATVALYRTEARLHILPVLGQRQLASITRADVENLIAGMREAEVGASTTDSTYRILRRVLSAAVSSERIVRNPALGLKIPKPQRRDARFLSPDELSLIAREVPERDRALILTLGYCGLRIGEALALRVKNVDLFRRRIQVEGAAKEVGGHRIEGPTKTKAKRSVHLPAFLADELMRHRAAFSDPNNPEAYFFTGGEGAPLRANNWRKRVLYPACARAGVTPLPRTHDL
jgi:integrase